MDKGWISLHRKFLDWEWFSDKNMIVLFIYLLLKANHSATKWQGVEINKGEFITSINKLSQALDISEQTIRTCLKKLEKTGEIIKKSTNKLTKITVCNYDGYQGNQQATNKQLTNNQQATNKQLTTNNNDNNNNNVNNNNKIYKSFDHLKISIDEFNNLQELGYSKSQIDNIILNIENYKANKKYKSLYLTALNWLKKEYPEAMTFKEKTYSYKIHFTTFRNKSEKQYKEDLKQYGKELKLL